VNEYSWEDYDSVQMFPGCDCPHDATDHKAAWGDWRTDEGARFIAATRFGQVMFRTEAAVATWQALTTRPYRLPHRPGPDEALARKAEAELALEDHYGVPVYASQALMLADHPPTADYLPPDRRPVRLPGPVLTGAAALAVLGECERAPE